jgi:hypothetical protein
LVMFDVIVIKTFFIVIWIDPSIQRIGAVFHSVNQM